MNVHDDASKTVIDQAHAFLRGHTTGDLRFDENMRPIKYVIVPDGRLAAPVMVAMLQAVDTVLFVPGASDDALELQVTLEQFDEHELIGGRAPSGGAGGGGAAADRWRIYHGEPQDVRWAFLSIDAARFEESIIDGEALTRSNPLADDESRLCRMMNQDHADDLRLMCARYGRMEIEQPVMVGIDALGFDVRARFDVVRVVAIEPMPTAEAAQRVLQAMAQSAREAE